MRDRRLCQFELGFDLANAEVSPARVDEAGHSQSNGVRESFEHGGCGLQIGVVEKPSRRPPGRLTCRVPWVVCHCIDEFLYDLVEDRIAARPVATVQDVTDSQVPVYFLYSPRFSEFRG